MRQHASKLRAEAAKQPEATREWTMTRVAFFERCADEGEKIVPRMEVRVKPDDE